MKRYFIILMIILALSPVLLVGCGQEATLPAAQQELENRITILETKLTAAESTIEVLQERIEQLEKEPLTEEDILRTLEGKNFGVTIKQLPTRFNYHTWIVFAEWFPD